MSAAAPDTWMPLWIGPYLANTLHLNRAQHGSYCLLIMACWKAGGRLPANDEALANIAKCSAREWRTERAVFAAFFNVGTEWWTHERVVSELRKAEAFVGQRRNAGLASAEARQRQREANERSTDRQRQARTTPTPSPSTVTPNSCVANSAHAREPVSRSQLITEAWTPTEDEIVELRKEIPWLIGDLYASRMRDFRDWCASTATLSFNSTATWRGFMRKTKPPAVAGETYDQRRIRLAMEAIRS